MSPELFARYGILNVSRETISKFETYAGLLLKWQKTINLVGASTLDEVVLRHFIDSAQLINFIPDRNIVLADMGSGAGFPGLVLAMLGIREVHLIESDVRKATFLRNVSRETFLDNVIVHDDRVEDTKIKDIDIVSARALAPLVDLIRLTQELGASTALFLKGEKAEEEVLKAKKRFDFTVTSHQSVTDDHGKVLYISDIR